MKEKRPASEPMVLFDATAVPADRGGVGRYVDAVIGHLDNPLIITCQHRDREHYAALAPAAIILAQSTWIETSAMRLAWEQAILPIIAARRHVGLIHSPHYTIPLLTNKRRTVTFHDATFFSDPQVHTLLKRMFFRFWIRVSSRLADGIIVPSGSTAAETSKYVARAPSEFIVAHHGVDTSIFHPPPLDEIERTRRELRMGASPWIAFLGTVEPRKNLPSLVRAYGRLAQAWRADVESLPRLAIAGGRGWETELDRAIESVEFPGEVAQLGFLPVDTLRSFLGGARLVVYPSLGEGFGLPVVEAMACGAPVLTTRNLALPEVGGDAVAYSGTDEDALFEALLHLVTNDAALSELRRAGLKRSAEFTWDSSARIHAQVFAHILAGGQSVDD